MLRAARASIVSQAKNLGSETCCCHVLCLARAAQAPAFVVQWIGRDFAEVVMQVRFLPRAHQYYVTITLMSDASTMHTYASMVFMFIMLTYWTGAFIILYHLIRFGVGSKPKQIAIFFLAGSLILSIVTTLFFAQVLLS